MYIFMLLLSYSLVFMCIFFSQVNYQRTVTLNRPLTPSAGCLCGSERTTVAERRARRRSRWEEELRERLQELRQNCKFKHSQKCKVYTAHHAVHNFNIRRLCSEYCETIQLNKSRCYWFDYNTEMIQFSTCMTRFSRVTFSCHYCLFNSVHFTIVSICALNIFCDSEMPAKHQSALPRPLVLALLPAPARPPPRTSCRHGNRNLPLLEQRAKKPRRRKRRERNGRREAEAPSRSPDPSLCVHLWRIKTSDVGS